MTIGEKLQIVVDFKKSVTDSYTKHNLEIPDKLADFNIEDLYNKGVSEGGSGIVTSFTGEKTFTSFEDAKELNYYNVPGALLWQKNDDATFLVNNGDSSAEDYWNPQEIENTSTPTKNGYTLIGVCVGQGLWAYVNWKGLTNMYVWSAGSNDISKLLKINIHGNGWDSTLNIRTNTIDSKRGSIWWELDSMMYIPSKREILEIIDNCCANDHELKDINAAMTQATDNGHNYTNNISKLLSLTSSDYLTSSLYSTVLESGDAFAQCFTLQLSDLLLIPAYKSNKYRSIALIHFGTYDKYNIGEYLYSDGNYYYTEAAEGRDLIGVCVISSGQLVNNYKARFINKTEIYSCGYYDGTNGTLPSTDGIVTTDDRSIASTDYNGKENTALIAKMAIDNYFTGIFTNNNVEYEECAAYEASQFKTTGTQQGDWYLPALGEIISMDSNYTEKDSEDNYKWTVLKNRYITFTEATGQGNNSDYYGSYSSTLTNSTISWSYYFKSCYLPSRNSLQAPLSKYLKSYAFLQL